MDLKEEVKSLGKHRPLIGISVGDPAGIGPEITAKSLALPEIYDICKPLAVAETEMMKEAIRFSPEEYRCPVNSV
jgi:4-hydroxy-L-threonine phosphate dehydrogenase PdxA